MRGVDAVLREVEREEGQGEGAGPCGGKEGVFGRGGVGTRSRKRDEVRRQRDGHSSEYLQVVRVKGR